MITFHVTMWYGMSPKVAFLLIYLLHHNEIINVAELHIDIDSYNLFNKTRTYAFDELLNFSRSNSIATILMTLFCIVICISTGIKTELSP